MGRKVLADWLTDKFHVDKKDKVVANESFVCRIKGEKVDIPDSAIWCQEFTKRDNPDLVVSIIPTLLHAYCLQLAEEHEDIVKLKTAVRVYHRWPWESNGTMHGYMTITNSDGVMADGEVQLKTVQPSMIPYICTIMNKRAEDRLILKALGLYQQGFFSQDEFPTDANDVESYSSNSISKEEIERKKRNTVMGEVKELSDEAIRRDPEFNPKTYAKTLLALDDLTQATVEQWESVKNGLRARLNS